MTILDEEEEHDGALISTESNLLRFINKLVG